MKNREYRVIIHDGPGPRLKLAAATAGEALKYAREKRRVLSAKVQVTDASNLALTDEELERRIRDEDLANR